MFKITKIKLIQLLLGILCLVFILFTITKPQFKINRMISRLDGYIYDHMTNMSLYTTNKPSIVIIDINNESIKEEGRWPWPRDKLVSLITKLKKAEVAVIGLDVVLAEPEINYAIGLKRKINSLNLLSNVNKEKISKLLDDLSLKTDNDKAFSNAVYSLRAFPNALYSMVVLGYVFYLNEISQAGAIPDPISSLSLNSKSEKNFINFRGYKGVLSEFLAASNSSGFVTQLPDDDGVIRHGLLVGNYNLETYSSLALSIVMNYFMTSKVTLVHPSVWKGIFSMSLEVGGIIIPINQHGQILIPYYGLPGTLDTYSAHDVLNDRIPADSLDSLKGAIAIIGSSMLLLSDLNPTPVSPNFPGAEIVGNMVKGILSQQIRAEYKLDTVAGMLIIGIIGLIYAFALPFLGPVPLILIYIFSLLFFLILSFILFVYTNVYLATASIMSLISLQTWINFSSNFILERLQKNKINLLFGQYLPESHIKELLESPEKFDIEEDTRDMTAFFSDIRNFTTLSEPLAAKDIKRLLNTFFTPVTEIIFNHSGTIDKYVGDMVVAFWGAPSEDKQHAYHAICASLEIKDRLFEINQTLVKMELPALNIGIGLSSGMMDVGDMGSTFRRAYTVLGDSVNLASRLQDLTKYYRITILVSDATRENQDAFFWWPVDKVAVKGRRKVLKIYTPLGYFKDASLEMKAELKEYELALSYYYNKEWLKAIKQFKKLLESRPGSHLYEIYISRCEEFIKKPPEKSWDGAYIFQSNVY